MLKRGCVGRASLLANWTPLFSWSPSGWAIGGNFTAEPGFSLCDIWISWAPCLAKNCQKQNDWGVWNSTVPSDTVKHLYPKPALTQHRGGRGGGGCSPLLSLYLWMLLDIRSPQRSLLLPHSLLWMQYVDSVLSRFRHFFPQQPPCPQSPFCSFFSGLMMS